MNKLSRDKQEMVLRCLVDGASVRATERIVGVHRDTILRLMVRVSKRCEEIMEERMRNLYCRHIAVDEQWSYVFKKSGHMKPEDNPNVMGDFWVWVAVDVDTRRVPHRLRWVSLHRHYGSSESRFRQERLSVGPTSPSGVID